MFSKYFDRNDFQKKIEYGIECNAQKQKGAPLKLGRISFLFAHLSR
jgi:hypothetical protein